MAFLFIHFTELSLLATIRKIPDFCFPSARKAALYLHAGVVPACHRLGHIGTGVVSYRHDPRVSKTAAGCSRVVLPPVLCSDAVSGFKTNNKK